MDNTSSNPFIAQNPENKSLRANSFGWSGQMFQSIAHMAPAIGVIEAVPFMVSRAGSALPLAMAFGGVLALFLAYCLSRLTKKFYGASGYFQIHSRALGSRVGFTTSWLFLIYEPINLFATSFGFGVLLLEPFSRAYLGVFIPWWIAPLVANFVVTGLSLANVKRSMLLTGILASIEIVIFTVLAIVLLHNSPAPFHPQYFLPSASADGFGGLMFAFIFGFLTYVGYESGLPLTEETKDTKSSTSKGLMLSVIFAIIFFTFISYATVVGFGNLGSIDFAKTFSGAQNPYGLLSLSAFGVIGPWILFIAAINSTIACCLASNNSATRVLFALGRAKILPSWLSRTTDANKVPARAVFTTFFISLFMTGLGYVLSKNGNPMDWYGLVGIILVLPLLIIHLVTCFSVFIAYRRTADFHPISHGLVPLVAGLLVLLPIWGAVYYNLQPPYSYAPYVVGIWFIIGVGVYILLKSKNPVALKRLETEMDLLRT